MRVAPRYAVASATLLVSLAGCARPAALTATTPPPVSASSVSKPGFYTEVRGGRLWVFREGSTELDEFKKQGEPAHQVTRIGGGPNGMTIKSHEAAVIDEYLAAK